MKLVEVVRVGVKGKFTHISYVTLETLCNLKDFLLSMFCDAEWELVQLDAIIPTTDQN